MLVSNVTSEYGEQIAHALPATTNAGGGGVKSGTGPYGAAAAGWRGLFAVLLLLPLLSVPEAAVAQVDFSFKNFSAGRGGSKASSGYVYEGETITYTVSKNGNSPASVDYATVDGSAKAPGDYVHVSGTLEFGRRESEKTITIQANDDSVAHEGHETFRLVLSNPVGGRLSGSQPTSSLVVIRPVHPAGLSFLSVPNTVSEGGSDTYEVWLDRKPADGDVTVTISGQSGTDVRVDTDSATAGNQNTMTFTSSSWWRNDSRTVTISAVEDSDSDRDAVTLTHTASGGGYDGVSESIVVDVDDNDSATDTPVIIFYRTAFSTTEGNWASIRVQKLGNGAASVEYGTQNGTAVAPADYAATTGTLNFGYAPGSTLFFVPTVNDGATEGDETFTVALGRPTGAVLQQSTATVTISDPPMNSPPVVPPAGQQSTVTISADLTSVTEGGDVTFTVTADPAPASDLVVNVSAEEEMGAGDDRAAGGHFGTATIWAGAASATWTLTTLSDEVDLADGTVVGRIEAGDGYEPGEPSSVTLTLLDDDEPATDGLTTQSEGDSVVGDPVPPGVDAGLVAEVTAKADGHSNPAAAARLRRIVKGMTGEAGGYTAEECRETAIHHGVLSTWQPWCDEIARREALAGVGTQQDRQGTDQQGTDQQEVTPEPPAVCVSPELLSDVEGYAGETHEGAARVERWLRVLHTLKGTANDATIMLSAEAQTYADRGWQRWVPVVTAIECLEAAAGGN